MTKCVLNVIAWVFIFAGVVEAVWGLCQMYGLAQSYHSLFALTGSFYNPGPYSGFLSMTFPVCLHKCLESRANKKSVAYCLTLIAMLLIISVLPAGMSRSAWIAGILASVYVVILFRGTYPKELILSKKRISLFLILTIVFFIGIYFLKKDSANGRILMWKIATEAVIEQPWNGYGWDYVAGVYGQAQEKYFSEGNYTKLEEYVADSPSYVFNEYLQVALAWGIPVLCLLLLVISISAYGLHRKRNYGLCGALLSLCIFSFASYPFQFWLFIASLGVLLIAGISCILPSNKMNIVFLSTTISCGGLWLVSYVQKEEMRNEIGEKIHLLYQTGQNEEVVKESKSFYEQMQKDSRFMFEYGCALHKQQRHEESNEVLEEALNLTSVPTVQYVIGLNYQKMQQYHEAETWLLRSTKRLPGRIYPYYLLAKLYNETDCFPEEKLKWAVRMVLEKEPKVYSTAIKQMREEVKVFVSPKENNE